MTVIRRGEAGMVKVVPRSPYRRRAELGGGAAVEERVEPHEAPAVLEVEADSHPRRRPARHPATRGMAEQEMVTRAAMGRPQTVEDLHLPLVHHQTRPMIPTSFAREEFSTAWA
ncbi:unnamed protein product [Vitrella brassicaformis CCMP3155]|uniref:Uncharacterized protein n=1 Tax=Vitrella brassicaformis (strain CCMP3155) TaxID=1169540 RepID=A0A0G4E8T9_VITBC|nr:unnamed protein product [Vitrella brassicaformis CCMP3155]|eukprot:CEL92306.1 unnamed protein product [Vitrella brassicaformis CCMP3155]